VGTSYAKIGGSRILSINGATDHSGADDAGVIDWVKATEFILAVTIQSGGKDTVASTYKLQWQDNNDGGGYVDLAASGEANYTIGDSSWSHGATVATGDQKCNIVGGDTRQAGERIKGTSTSDSIDLADEYQSELWFGVDVSGADDNHVYSFQLYSIAENAAIGICGATIQMAAGATPYYKTISNTVGLADTVATMGAFKKTVSEAQGITDTIATSVGFFKTIANSIGIADAISTFITKIQSFADTVGITDTVSAVGAFIKNIANNVGITDVISSIGAFVKAFANTVGSTDAIATSIGFFKTIADTVGITDVISNVRVIIKLLTDTVGITDGTIEVGDFIKAPTDTVGITDSLTTVYTPGSGGGKPVYYWKGPWKRIVL